MSEEKKYEIIRKIFHMLLGITIIFLVIYRILTTRTLFYLLLFLIFLSIISMQIKNKKIKSLLKKFSKKGERPYGRGVIFFIFGCLLTLKIFPINTALASISILTFADPLSYIFGNFFGKTKIINNHKNIEGTIVGIIIGTFFSSFFVNFVLAFLACIASMTAEYLEFKIANNTIDDNLVIPLVAATTIHLLSQIK